MQPGMTLLRSKAHLKSMTFSLLTVDRSQTFETVCTHAYNPGVTSCIAGFGDMSSRHRDEVTFVYGASLIPLTHSHEQTAVL